MKINLNFVKLNTTKPNKVEPNKAEVSTLKLKNYEDFEKAMKEDKPFKLG